MSRTAFWQAVYIAAIRAGKSAPDARWAADLAADHWRDATLRYEEAP